MSRSPGLNRPARATSTTERYTVLDLVGLARVGVGNQVGVQRCAHCVGHSDLHVFEEPVDDVTAGLERHDRLSHRRGRIASTERPDAWRSVPPSTAALCPTGKCVHARPPRRYPPRSVRRSVPSRPCVKRDAHCAHRPRMHGSVRRDEVLCTRWHQAQVVDDGLRNHGALGARVDDSLVVPVDGTCATDRDDRDRQNDLSVLDKDRCGLGQDERAASAPKPR